MSAALPAPAEDDARWLESARGRLAESASALAARFDIGEDIDRLLLARARVVDAVVSEAWARCVPADAALSLLATEAFTNALKYSGVSDPDAEPWVRVSLRADGPGHAVLEVENSIGASSLAEGTGLGSQLIEAFATQLEGEAEQEMGEGRFLLRLRFQVENLHKREGAEMPQVVLTSAARPGSRH